MQVIVGALRKPPGQRQRRNKVENVPMRSETEVASTPPPDPPATLSDVNQKFWRELWRSKLSPAILPDTDMPALTRLFALYDERDRLDEVWKDQQLILDGKIEVVGKDGVVKMQNAIKVNPLRGVIATCDEQIMKLEDRFGLNPISRLRLGIKFEQLSSKTRKPLAPQSTKKSDDPRKFLREA